MHAILAFGLVLIAITILGIRYRIPPFILLVGAAFVYGVMAEVPFDRIIPSATSGAGGTFAMLGIVIFAGAVIAAVLEKSGYLQYILNDMRRLSRQPGVTAVLSGYLLTIPLMCCITAYIVVHPLLTCFQHKNQNILLYLAAVGSVLSFVLIYPSPVTVALLQIIPLSLDTPYQIDLLTVPLSLLLLGITYLWFRNHLLTASDDDSCPTDTAPSRLRLWAPFLVIIIMVAAGLSTPFLRLVANVNIALFIGMLVALLSAPKNARTPALSTATKRAGTIIFDLCGAGAFGAVIGVSSFSTQIFGALTPSLPLILIPFILAALIQTAQGSRTVTTLLTAQILVASGAVALFHPLSLILMILAGTMVISYLSDPYFWLIQRTTMDEPRDVVRQYTLPLAVMGCILFGFALLLPFIG